MALTTPRYALRYPQTTDPDAVPADMLRLATDCDNTFSGYSSGTLASRPAAGISGRRYRATDTGYVYLDTGAVWITDITPRADAQQTPLAYNAAWPASPVNGQEVDRYADAGATVIWRFRYDGTQAVGSRWVFIGGGKLAVGLPAMGATSALNTYGGTTWINSGNSWTPGIAGVFDFEFEWWAGQGGTYGGVTNSSISGQMIASAAGSVVAGAWNTGDAGAGLTLDTAPGSGCSAVFRKTLAAATLYSAFINSRWGGSTMMAALGFRVQPSKVT